MNKVQLTNALQLEMKINADIVRIEKEWAKAQFYCLDQRSIKLC
jgi:hypothetical protein